LVERKSPWAFEAPWTQWYVWYPRLITDDVLGITAIIWLETVDRRKVDGRWEYRIAR
jgi:hypothetical protein